MCDRLNGLNIEKLVQVDSSSEAKDNSFVMYAVLGEYPNIFIDTKYYVAHDNYNYCLKDVKTSCIDVYKKDRVFCTYEEANNKVISLLQDK